jgi:hypothetical protein
LQLLVDGVMPGQSNSNRNKGVAELQFSAHITTPKTKSTWRKTTTRPGYSLPAAWLF